MELKQATPSVLAAQKERKEYHKPTFEVIDLNMESPLLAGSGIGSKRQGYPNQTPQTW
jgi:hypothetical protein